MKKALLTLAALLFTITGANAQQVTGLSDWNIFLDPGHGGSNQNTGIFGYSEADKVLAIGLHLREMLLETTDIDTVYISRTADIDVSLAQRVDYANTVGAAHFHSIHSNAGPPEANHVFVLWPQYRDGSEAVPNGGRRMSEIMGEVLGRSMRIPSFGGFGECDFYGAASCRDRDARNSNGQGKGGSRNYVQSFTNMPSELSEAGFHTNPVQNQRNMNADWKRLEAKALYWSILDYHGLARPTEHIAAGFVGDIETGRPINGATVAISDTTYTTDTYASLFNRYSNDPDLLGNGFFYLDRLPGGTLPVTVEADQYLPVATEVTMADTFFTLLDVQMISTVPPYLAGASPAANPNNFRITDPLVFDFSRKMDRASVENAFSLSPETPVSFRWDRGDTRLIVTPDTLLPLTSYTLTIAGSALGLYGHMFDGNADGAGGDAFSLSFRTGYPDTAAPRLLASYPRVGARDVELLPVITLTYDEPIDPASLEGLVHLERTTDQNPVGGETSIYVVQDQGLLTFFPKEELDPDTPYQLTVLPGLRDAFGNAETVPKQVRFTTGNVRSVVTPIDGFEAGFEANWWAPQQSGSTVGIVTDSTRAVVDSSIVNLLTDSNVSVRLEYGWDLTADQWLIREYLGGGPPRAVVFDASYRLEAFVFGDGSGNQFRFAVDDNITSSGSGHEVSPWFTVDWLGWRRVSWNMSEDSAGAWIGDGNLDGALRFDSIQLTHTPGAGAFGRLFFDDLRLVRETPVSTGREPAGEETPKTFALHQNYPNPFNPQTTIRFDLPRMAEVNITVFNELGARVAVLADQTSYAAGTHEITWSAADLPSGVYFCRVQAGDHTRAIKLLLIK